MTLRSGNFGGNSLSIYIDFGIERFTLCQTIDPGFRGNDAHIPGRLQNLSIGRNMTLLSQLVPFAFSSQKREIHIRLFKMRFILFELFFIFLLRTITASAQTIRSIQILLPQGGKIAPFLIARGFKLHGGRAIPNEMLRKDGQSVAIIAGAHRNHIPGLQSAIIKEINGGRMIGRSRSQFSIHIIGAQLLSTSVSSCRRKGLFWIM